MMPARSIIHPRLRRGRPHVTLIMFLLSCIFLLSAFQEIDHINGRLSGYVFVDALQGIAHDDQHWYVTSTAAGGSIARYPKKAKLGLDHGGEYVTDIFSPEWRHPGDIDHSDGWIYVALERDASVARGTARRNAIGAIPVATFNQRETYRTFEIEAGPQMRRGSMPWIARDPGTDYFYSSIFKSTDKLQRYRATFDAQGAPTGFERCGEVTLSEKIARVQGGDFSAAGNLYISTDPKTPGHIIKVIKLKGHLDGLGPIDCAKPPATHAAVVKALPLDKDYSTFAWPAHNVPQQEVEGITISEPDEAEVGALPDGEPLHIHTLLVDKALNIEGWWLKHHRITPHSDDEGG